MNSLLLEPGVTAGAVTAQDVTFAQTAALSGLSEVAEGRLAMQATDTPLVQVFGHWMVANHEAVSQVLTSLAEKLDITLPTGLDAEHQAMLSQLQDLEGEAFDQAYASMQVEMHQAAVSLFQQQATSGGNPALKALAAGALPTLQTHLQQAQVIAGSAGDSDMGGTTGRA